MPVYKEKFKVNGQNVWYLRTYVKFTNGKMKQTSRHNKNLWIGKEGKKMAEWEEKNLSSTIYDEDEFYGRKKPTDEIQEEDKIVTFKKLFNLKMEDDELYNSNSESTRITYDECLRNHVFPFIGDMNIEEIEQSDLKNIIKHLKQHRIEKGRNKGKELSYKFKNEIIHTVKSIILYGIKYYNLNPNLTDVLIDFKEDRDKVKAVDPMKLINKQTIISPNDWEKISDAMEHLISEALPEEKERVTKMMLFFTTEYILLTRVGETQGMTYKNLFFQQKIYCLYEAYNKRLKKVTPTKNRTSRILYISDALFMAFKKMYEIDSKKPGFKIDQYIFGGDKVFPRTTIDRYRTKLLKRANLGYMTNHELRHAGISNAVHNNVDLSALADMSGHDKEMTLKVYTQTLKEANGLLINTLNNIKVFSY